MAKDEEILSLISNIRNCISAGSEGLSFEPISHTYTYKGVSVKSVSVMCEMFEAPFDTDYWSKEKARQRGCSPQEILEQWKSISGKACDEGTDVHSYGELHFYRAAGLPVTDPEIVAIEEKRKDPKYSKDMRFKAVEDVWSWLQGEFKDFRFYPVAAENKVVNPELGYAGTFDLLFLCVRDDGRKGLIIFDYKTNGNLFNIYRPRGAAPVSMLEPFKGTADCNAAHYTCQLSLYQLGLERAIDIPVIGRVLFWVNPIGAALIAANDPAMYKKAHERLTKAGEKSKWNYFSGYRNDIEYLKKLYGFSYHKTFAMLRLPYVGDRIRDYLSRRVDRCF